jgi:hypothetical protein
VPPLPKSTTRTRRRSLPAPIVFVDRLRLAADLALLLFDALFRFVPAAPLLFLMLPVLLFNAGASLRGDMTEPRMKRTASRIRAWISTTPRRTRTQIVQAFTAHSAGMMAISSARRTTDAAVSPRLAW